MNFTCCPKKYFALIALFLLAISFSSALAAENYTNISDQIVNAKPGTIIDLPAGEIKLADVTIPAGITLRGAGYAKTTLMAGSGVNCLRITNADNVTISDLTIRGAREAGIRISDASKITLARLRLIGNLNGMVMENIEGLRIENVILAENRTGVSLSRITKSALVNITAVNNNALALAITGSTSVSIFNNLFINSPTSLYLGAGNSKLNIDYNLFIANFIGKLSGEGSRSTLAAWQAVSGYDRHSLVLPIILADVAKEDYHPVSRLEWLPTCASSSNWGVKSLAGSKAPSSDIDGKPRNGEPDLGVYEINFTVTEKPAGSFKVNSNDGVKSAGLFTTDGVNVNYLFQNLPLKKGSYPFWLPARDYQGKVIPAGDYQLRVTESNLQNEYLGLAGNYANSPDMLDNCSWGENFFAFDNQDRIYITQGWTENHMGVRAFDAAYNKPRWMISSHIENPGAVADNSYLYVAQEVEKGLHSVRRFELESGRIVEFAPGVGTMDTRGVFSEQASGLTELGGVLYIADPLQNKLYYAPAAAPRFSESFSVPAPSSAVADRQQKLIWLISGGEKLLALDAKTGEVKYSATPVPSPAAIAINNGRMAILSPITGKIHIFDCCDPANLKPVRTIGTGDGPFGPITPDRFWFQTPTKAKMNVAINSKGEVAVVDSVRVSFWDAEGKLIKQGIGFWGQHLPYGKFAGDNDVRFWSTNGDYSMKMDSKNHRWLPDTNWQLPDLNFQGRSPMGFFTTGGKNYGMYVVSLNDQVKRAYALLEFSGHVALTRALYYFHPEEKTLAVQYDADGNGVVDEKDPIQPLQNADGTPVPFYAARYDWLDADTGDIQFPSGSGNTMATVIPMKGLGENNIPFYDWVNPILKEGITADGKQATIISPYDYKTLERLNGWVMQIPSLSDGGYAASIALKTSGGTGLANGAGTDIAGFGPDGKMRWLHKLNFAQGSEGVQTIPKYKLVLGMDTTQCNYMAMDEDGLGMGMMGMPRESHWGGMWSDHAQQQAAWVGNDGKPYYVLGDYVVNGFHWFAIKNADKVMHQRLPVTINADTAAELAARPLLLPAKPPAPPTPKVLIRKLAAPLAIDGNLQKWRDAGITPVALVTPESGSADITGPEDCSAIIRLAYYGKDLYVQTLVFDNVVTFHQPLSKMYQQDGVEMSVNSFMEGFKFNIGITSDNGVTVFRNKFVIAAADRIYTPEQVPRVVKVLDSASDVEERALIEAVYGVDLSKSKVIVSEFKLRFDDTVAFQGGYNSVIPEIASGKSFWLGFFINDNDIAGSDIQKLLAWPATYGTFAVKEAGALATFE